MAKSKHLFVCDYCQEIHPVRVADLSFVSGGVCSSKDILDKERLVLNVSWFLLITIGISEYC